ncbi:MAG: hypothetical protein EOO23_05430 [Comamonadaceae bacterium]|nr:MAG: hypothetical protein EOO23_05430 [Comamonadaceae bacterium]
MSRKKSEPVFYNVLVSYLGTWLVAGCVYTLHLYRTSFGMYQAELRIVRPDGELQIAVAPRFYDDDLQAMNGEMEYITQYVVGLGIDLETVFTIHRGGERPKEPLPTDNDFEAAAWYCAGRILEKAMGS